MIRVDVFGNEKEWRPITKWGVEMPGYFVSKEGEVLSEARVTRRYYCGKKTNGENYKKSPFVGWTDMKVPERIMSGGKTIQYREYGKKGKVKGPIAHVKVALSVPWDTFKGTDNNYNYQLSSNYNTLPHEKSPIQFSLTIHKAVKEAYHPFDDYTHEVGISKEDWEKTPESVKLLVEECIYIDHKDDDPTNNHLDNLQYSTPKQNNCFRKKRN